MRVLLADDHQLILDAIRRTLVDAPDMEIVGAAETGAQVIPLIARTDPDVVLLDLRMPQLDGLACLDQIRSRYPKVKVIILSACGDPRQIRAALRRGASGYVLKSVNPLDLPSAIRQSFEGSVFNAVDDEDGAAGSATKAAGLSERETSILQAVARGLSNAAIGQELWVSEQTIKFHLRNIYRKLGVSNRTEAARYAHQEGLVERAALEVA